MKQCPKCNKSHNKSGIFCSRSCANSRSWNDKDRKKKSESAKKSEKVLLANKSDKKRKQNSESLKLQYKNGRSRDLSHLHTKEIYDKIEATKRKKRKNRISKVDKLTKLEYRNACQFRFNLSDYNDEFDFNLIEEYGWYSASNRGNNLDGISRDHMYSVSEGYKNNIHPDIIAHPANCMLMQHRKNSSKYTHSSIKLNELLKRIDEWNIKYGPVA
jgi:hypothetical protein